MRLTQKSMRKKVLVIQFVVALFLSSKSNAQTADDIQNIALLLGDALFFSEQYIQPATDAAIYQSSSGWIVSPKKKERWKVTLGLHANAFFVPKNDREFTIQNSDFSFFEIEGATSAVVPTAMGNPNQVYLVGEIGGEQVRLETPRGVNQEAIVYPYLQGTIELPYGFEFIGRYSTKTKLKKGYYQVYGLGLKHNFSQYFSKLEAKNINIALATIYSNEEISFDFLDINTAYGNLGINKLTSRVDTFHFILSASKEFKKFELISNLIVNTSNFEYIVSGQKGEIEEIIPLQQTINSLLETIAERKTNVIGEISGRYQFDKFYLQSSFAFGKFANLNLGVQYQF